MGHLSRVSRVARVSRVHSFFVFSLDPVGFVKGRTGLDRRKVSSSEFVSMMKYGA